MRLGRGAWASVVLLAALLLGLGGARPQAWAQETLLRPTLPHWSGQPLPEGAARFTFAVIADLWSGQPPRSTVPADTIKEINLLDPDFTICVGDLVKGYTDNPDEVKAQRDEFETIVAKLKRPFYCVFGNHDAANPMMDESLKKRYGTPWYSFNYKNSHFIVLYTESRNAAGELLNSIDPEQLGWLKRDMAANPNAQQYFIFMHKPLMDDPSWQTVETLFEGKQLTVFMGHTHVYRQETRNGHDYVTLSTTGGGIKGETFWTGGFYHSALVTVTGKESSIAVIRTGAIIPHDLLNGPLLDKLAQLRHQAESLVYEVPRDALEVNGDYVVTFANPLATPMIGTFNWALLPDSPWKVAPMQTDFVIEPGQTAELKFHLKYPADPFGPNPADPPGYTIVMRSGLAKDASTPYERGRDEVVNVRARLKVNRWPHTATLAALRSAMDLDPVVLTDKPLTVTRTVNVRNAFAYPITVALSWKSPNPAWTVKPASTQLLLPAHQNAPVNFEFSCTATGAATLPVPILALSATLEGQSVFAESRPLPVNLRQIFAGYCPVAKVPPLSADPKIDGILDEPAWAEAAVLGPFVDIKGMGQAPVDTDVRVGRGRTGLYVAVVCHDPDMAHLVTQERARDADIFKDDFIELFLDASPDHLTYYHLAVNPSGATFDARNRRDTSWDGRWLSAVTRSADRWTVEFFIPWSDLGGPPAPEGRWGFDVGRKRLGRLPEPSYTFWSPSLRDDSRVPERFGILLFP